ncbi:MAG TPA: HAMP domain-containing sensor histidine kinase [Myxococcota bacterium]|nr:HAMP domain-containing sensor histidine kinase [Myxococcota bacterium]
MAAASSAPDVTSAGLRHATASAAELARGVALLFARNTADSRAGAALTLRAAAGFATAEEARAAAKAIEPWAHDVASGAGVARSSLRTLGPRAAAAVVGAALSVGERSWGALIVGAGAPQDERALAGFAGIAQSAALCLDHSHLQARVAALEKQLADRAGDEEPASSDEVLKLSEALFAQDIELLRKSEQLGKVEKLKSDFIEKMSRELRTPLNSIIEAIIAVLAGENEQLSDSAKESLRAALDDGTTFQRTLQNILDLWRIKQGELPVQTQEVNFREVIEEAIFSVQDALGERPITIERGVTEPLSKFRTDLAKVNQILFLLLDNAVKFTTSGTIEIQAAVARGQLRCSVRDTGIGICADDRQFIFDEFFQVEEANSLRYRGAGLGLTLVRELVALLDGSVEVVSEIGQGTTVTFSIPVQSLG